MQNIFKKGFFILMAVVCILSFASCGEDVSEDDDTPKQTTKKDKDEDKGTGTTDTAKETEGKPETEAADTTEAGQKITYIDAFSGIEFFSTGISPYCELSVDNSECSIEAQKYVSYAFDKKYYANGDKIVLTAALSSSVPITEEKVYMLAETEKEFALETQPEYLSTLDGVNLAMLESELADYIAGETSKAVGKSSIWGVQFVIGSYGGTITSIDKIELCEKYFSQRKVSKQGNPADMFNQYSFVYKLSIAGDAWGRKGSFDAYVCINAINIVKYPDDTLGWGETDPQSLAFAGKAVKTNINDCITRFITVNRQDYNVKKIEVTVTPPTDQPSNENTTVTP